MADVNAGVSGAASGAVAGGAIGSVIPGVGTAIGAGAGAVIGGLGGLFGGGGESEQGLRLPKELEFKMLDDAFANMERLKADYQRASQVYDLYQQRFDTLAQSNQANVPPDEIRKQLASNTADLAMSLGTSVQDAIKNGFLSSADMEDLKALKDLESQDFKDPAYEAARAQQKQQLLQNLQRQGASPQQISQAMTEFDNQSTIGGFQVSQQLRASQSALISNRIGVRQGLQQQNFGFGQGALASQLGALGQYGQMIGQTGQLYGMGMQAAGQGFQIGQSLRQENQQMYKDLGGFIYSKQGKKYLQSGSPQSGNYMTPDRFKEVQAQAKVDAAAQEQAAHPGKRKINVSGNTVWV